MNIERCQEILQPVLAPLGMLYAGVMRLRRAAYAAGLLASWRADAPTVSVGNISWGGTGKTPITGWLLRWALERQIPPLVLTRGYGARPASCPHRVRPGDAAAQAGDEPLMLCRQHPGADIVVDPLRSRAGRWAQEHLRPGLVILDDGFQHLGVERDINLVLLKPSDLEQGWNRVNPAGAWREGRSALTRADAFLIKISEQGFRALLPRVEQRLARFGKPVFSFAIQPQGLVRLPGGEAREHFHGEPYLLVTGVGDPAQVARTATDFLGYAPADHLIYPDHHAFTRQDATDMQRVAARKHCAHVLCTPKDAVKLGPLAQENFWTLDLDVRFGLAWPGYEQEAALFGVWWAARFDAVRAGRAERSGVEAEQSATNKKRTDSMNHNASRTSAEESKNFGQEK